MVRASKWLILDNGRSVTTMDVFEWEILISLWTTLMKYCQGFQSERSCHLRRRYPLYIDKAAPPRTSGCTKKSSFFSPIKFFRTCDPFVWFAPFLTVLKVVRFFCGNSGLGLIRPRGSSLRPLPPMGAARPHFWDWWLSPAQAPSPSSHNGMTKIGEAQLAFFPYWNRPSAFLVRVPFFSLSKMVTAVSAEAYDL